MEPDNLTPTEIELLDELLDAIGNENKPAAEDGWFTIRDMHKRYNKSRDQLRDALEEGVLNGTVEKTKWGRDAYYRKVRK